MRTRTAAWVRRLTFAVVSVALCAGIARAQQGPTTLYVAPNGSDAATGERGKPLATLTGARDAIRRLKRKGALPKGGVTVEIAGGTYALSEPLALGAEDSGTAEAPVTYRAAKGQRVRLTGGRAVSGFAPVADPAVRARLDPAARDRVVQADMRAQGVTDYGEMTPRGFARPIRPAGLEVFFEDRPLPLARWPDEGFVRVTDVPSVPDRQVASAEVAERVGRWAAEPDLWAFGYWYHDWADSYDKISALDAAKATLTFAAPGSNYGYRKGQRFYVLNALSELDRPGEWYVDREKGILYLYPPAPVKPGSVVVSVAPTLATLTGASHVTLRGFTFEACRGDAVRISGGSDVRVAACTLRNVGNRAVVVGDGAARSGVVGCDIYETGDGGVVLNGGDRRSLTPARLFAENNQIRDYSRWCRTYRPGVSVGGVGNRVAHNLIFDGPHSAIQLSGNDHLIEFNEVHNVCYETGDVGAFYMGRDWTARGTVIRHNYFHDISGPGHIGAMGVYLDDQASGIAITGNVFARVTRAAFIGGGDDNTVTNNVFVDCVPAVHLDARGLGWQKAATDDPKGTLRTGYAAMPVSDELWRKKYPALVSAATESEPGAPRRNVVARNIAVGGRWSDVEPKAKDGITFTDNLTDADPRFVDAARGDYRLRNDSPALRVGFQPIPVAQIGLRDGPDRATWPVPHPVKPVLVPEAKKAAKSSLPAAPVVAIASGKAPMLDGALSAGEWAGTAPLVAEQEVGGEVTSPPSRVFVRLSGGDLYVAFENPVEVAVPLRTGSAWGQDDAVEVALSDAGSPGAPTYVLRGFAGGKFVSSPEAGASEEAARRAGSAVRYAAEVVSPSLWTAEMKIPLASLGLDPAKAVRLAANFTVRKSAGPTWVLWRGTGGSSWVVEKAGTLTFSP